MRFSAAFTAFILLTLICSGCGGGGGDAAAPLQFQPTPANSVIIKSAGPATTLYGVQFTLQFPTGVTLATPGGGVVAQGVLTPSGGGAGSSVSAYYDSGATPQTVTVSVTNSSGFQVGQFLTIATQVAPGTTLVPGNLVLTQFKAYDSVASGTVDTAITGEVSAP
ncbi:hypothetical protein [Citrifermentans bremense]|uniref:hypothetical protein n=1 Tax=Citrifermentans bremense TaxID=60035 RepID=UPI00040740E0|nr:hypothetical protein [Citrifermentans bremense]